MAKFAQRCAIWEIITTARLGTQRQRREADDDKPPAAPPPPMPVPMRLSNRAVAKICVARVSMPTARSTLAKKRVCAPAPFTVAGDDMRLLEIEDGGAEGEQADPGGDAEQIGRADQLGHGGEGAAADLPLVAAAARAPRRWRAPADRRKTPQARETAIATSSKLAGPSGPDSAIVMPGPSKPPAVPPAPMKPNRRLPCSLVNRSAMNDQNTATANRLKTPTQMKKTRATVTARRRAQRQPKRPQVGGEEVIDDGDEARARQPRHQRAVDRLRDQQRREDRGEEPRQRAESAGDRHLVAQRPQHVVARRAARRNRRTTTARPGARPASPEPGARANARRSVTAPAQLLLQLRRAQPWP